MSEGGENLAPQLRPELCPLKLGAPQWRPAFFCFSEHLLGESSIFIYLFIFLFIIIYIWLHWVFVARRGLSLVAASGG